MDKIKFSIVDVLITSSTLSILGEGDKIVMKHKPTGKSVSYIGNRLTHKEKLKMMEELKRRVEESN